MGLVAGCAVKRLPNLLSCSRIALSLALLFLMESPIRFAIVYLLCGLSDLADGFLARRLGAQTALGAKLDSLGDFFFYGVWLFVLIAFASGREYGSIVISAIVVAAIRAINLAITKVKFGQWSVMHTPANKLTGLILFVSLPIYGFAGDISLGYILAVGLVATLAALEESVTLLKDKSYHANSRGFLSSYLLGRLNRPYTRST